MPVGLGVVALGVVVDEQRPREVSQALERSVGSALPRFDRSDAAIEVLPSRG